MQLTATVLLIVLLLYISTAAATCRNCKSSEPDADASSDDLVEDLRNDEAPGLYDGTDWDWDSDSPEQLEAYNVAKAQDTVAKEQYVREAVAAKILGTLSKYGYQSGMPLNQEVLQTTERPKSPVDPSITSGFAENLLGPSLLEDIRVDDEDELESEAKSVIHLTPVPNKTNTFILDLSIVSVNTSAEAELLIEVPDGVRRVAVFERRQPRLVAKQWTVGDKWARLAIGKATLNRWRHSNVTLRVRFGRSTVKSKAPYVVVSLLPVAASAGAKRFRRSSSHCNLVAQYVVLRELLHLKTFPEGTNFYYCSGHCSHLDRPSNTGNTLLHRAQSVGAVPYTRACCVPTEYRTLSIMVVLNEQEHRHMLGMYNYTISDNNLFTTRLVKIDIPNLIANHCGCV